jgi:hypothetical protein
VGTLSSFTIYVNQSNTLGWKTMATQQATQQVYLWDASCSAKAATGSMLSDGTVRIDATNLPAGVTYYVSVKYDPGSLAAPLPQQVPNTKPTSVYTFETAIGTTSNVIAGSQAGVNVRYKK